MSLRVRAEHPIKQRSALIEYVLKFGSAGWLAIDTNAYSSFTSPDGVESIARFCLHRCEQYLTWSQSLDHFFRQLKGRSQLGQIFCGRLSFLCAIYDCLYSSNTFTRSEGLGGDHPPVFIQVISNRIRKMSKRRSRLCISILYAVKKTIK